MYIYTHTIMKHKHIVKHEVSNRYTNRFGCLQRIFLCFVHDALTYEKAIKLVHILAPGFYISHGHGLLQLRAPGDYHYR